MPPLIQEMLENSEGLEGGSGARGGGGAPPGSCSPSLSPSSAHSSPSAHSPWLSPPDRAPYGTRNKPQQTSARDQNSGRLWSGLTGPELNSKSGWLLLAEDQLSYTQAEPDQNSHRHLNPPVIQWRAFLCGGGSRRQQNKCPVCVQKQLFTVSSRLCSHHTDCEGLVWGMRSLGLWRYFINSNPLKQAKGH